MTYRVRSALTCAALLCSWTPLAFAQSSAPATLPPVAPAAPPVAPAAAPAPAAEPVAPAPVAAAPVAPAAAAAPAAEPVAPTVEAPAWPQSETECRDWAKNPPAAAVPGLEAEVSHRYLARVIPVVGFAAGGGLGSDPGFGWRVGARGDIGLLSPLWLSGSAYYARIGGKSNGQVELLTGLSLVSWGPRWVNAGVAQAGATVVAWGSHCQQRRNEFTLLAGGKLIFAAQSITALQGGFGEAFRTEGGFSHWSLTGLYDPAHPSYGGQVQIGFAGGLLPYPVYLGTVMGGMTGERKNWWGTIDVGAALEL